MPSKKKPAKGTEEQRKPGVAEAERVAAARLSNVVPVAFTFTTARKPRAVIQCEKVTINVYE